MHIHHRYKNTFFIIDINVQQSLNDREDLTSQARKMARPLIRYAADLFRPAVSRYLHQERKDLELRKKSSSIMRIGLVKKPTISY